MTRSPLTSAVAIAHALGHPARLRTVAMLRTGDLCVCQIGAVLELAPSTVSAHLRELRLAGLISERKDGRWVHIGLTHDPALRPWIQSALVMLEGDRRLAADDRLVEELRTLPVEELCRLGLEAARAKRRSGGCKSAQAASRPRAARRPSHRRREQAP